MGRYKVYNKLFLRSTNKPVGRAYVNMVTDASSAAIAKAKNDRDNAEWNRRSVKGNYYAGTVKVVQLTKKGTIKGKNKKRRSIFGPFDFI